ncbi:MAG: serine phosphatase [Rhizobacter sp.]|nr:serine phosphatase [Rhizobacter sp.]
MNLVSRTHVLFDLDGTLVDSREAVAQCYRQVFREHLKQDFPPPQFLAAEVFAMRPAELFARVAPERVDELHAAYQAGYPAAAAACLKVFEGADALIQGLVRSGRQPALVTNKGLPRTLIDLAHARIDTAWFSAIVTSEDTIERKPHPAPVQLGLQRAGGDPDDALYVGDGPHDVFAARAAGMPAIAVTYGFYAQPDLIDCRPDAWAHSMAELAELLGVRLERKGRAA